VGLCTAVDRPDLVEDPRFATKSDRISNYDVLRAELGARFATESRAWWLERLAACDVPAAPILDLPEMTEHPQVVASGIIDGPDAGRQAAAPVRSPVRIAGAHVAAELPAPGLSEHAAEVLASIGLSRAEVDRLRAERVIR
jgi:formyl-CoA transferase